MARLPSILFVHDNYPGQFGQLAAHLHGNGWEVRFATSRQNAGASDPWQIIRYSRHRAPNAQTHPYAQSFERAVLKGQACLRALLKAQIAPPDIVLSHAGPGAGLYLCEAFPNAHHIAYCEWWYSAPGPDTAFLAQLSGVGTEMHPEQRVLSRARNAAIASELLSADRGLCPTSYQADQFPAPLQAMLEIRHDGVDTEFFAPEPESWTTATLPAHSPIVSYATRGMEPHRGFPQVIAGLKIFLEAHPTFHAVIAGENRVFYGSDRDRRVDWRARAVAEFGPVDNRVHFLGTLDVEGYRSLLRRTQAHIYASVPFVLSWSLLEAMATAAPLVVSDTAPVREVVCAEDAEFFDLAAPQTLATALRCIVRNPQMAALKAACGRASIVRNYSAAALLKEHEAWLREGL